MRNLIDFILSHYHWFIFIALEAVSIVLLFNYNSYQGSVWVSSANSMAGLVYEGEAKIQSFFSLTRLNEQLSRRNVYLEQQVKELSAALERDGMDSTTLSALSNPTPYKLIPAQVVSNTVHKKDNLMTINKGEADGVRKDMGVVSGHGVVGIVYMAGRHYSVVIPALSSQSSISCKIERRGYFGYLHWEGGYSNLAYVDDIPRHARFKLYERVVTSGYSSVFPEGVAVGKILHVYNSSDGVSYRLQVQLYTDFANLRDVYVVDNSAMREQLDVLRAAQDSLYKSKN
ncbi:MAG: rod shape-determining protein MreC [Prevotellaceae bacterium]|nr:rod shape-determining protein MreC [Prevotella sp.]MDD7247671.1 rod shape-determining protein MreC [Prevotellaceae bacterium]MDY2750153.1 rod shape-determining protein MreC [Prevotella sp.]